MAKNGETKAPRRPVRRKTDKAVQAAPASARDKRTSLNPDAMSLKDADYNPPPEEVQRRAFEIYRQRGGGHGRDLEDWYEAERQLRRQQGKEPARG